MFMPCPPVSYYSGCGGNSNRYRTKAECRRRCFAHMANTTKDVTDEERRVITAVPRKSTDCQLPVLGGSCRRRMKMYAFSTDAGKCLAFSYTGCGGNEVRPKLLIRGCVNVPSVKGSEIKCLFQVLNQEMVLNC